MTLHQIGKLKVKSDPIEIWVTLPIGRVSFDHSDCNKMASTAEERELEGIDATAEEIQEFREIVSEISFVQLVGIPKTYLSFIIP